MVKRFATIDFLRGLAMLIMLMLHSVMTCLDIDGAIANIDNAGFIQLIALIVLPYLGGLAGFFLMVSAMGNMVSMQKYLQKGKPVNPLIVRQIVGGLILLVFAMLSEGLIGYHGTLGDWIHHWGSSEPFTSDTWRYRGYHFETIHTIAWCLIVNGVTHGLIMKSHKHSDFKQVSKIYILLAVIVLILTPFAWMLGDPYTQNRVFYPYIGESSFIDFVKAFFLIPLAGHPEPIMPYLAASYIGSIMGMYITQDKDKIERSTLRNLYRVGLIMFIIGTIGVIINVVMLMMSSDFDTALGLYQRIWDHRYWTADHAPFLGWFFQFLSLNGAGMLIITTFLRLVEFRGIAKSFAKKTAFVRRFGFIAFTIYTIQFVYYIGHYIVTSVLGLPPFQRVGWGPVGVIIIFTLVSFHLIMLAWEKVGYIFSLEWCIGTIAAFLIPARKTEEKQAWWKVGLLQTQEVFYEPVWIDLSGYVNEETYEVIQPEKMREDNIRIVRRLANVGFIMFPFAFSAFNIAKKNNDPAGKKRATMAIGFFVLWFGLSLVLSLSMFGVSLM